MNSEHRIINRSSGNLGKGDAPELWQSIIDQIPNHAFFKGMKILNICAGTGTEAVILVNRLKSLGWSTEEILESLWLIDKAKKFTGELKLKGFRHVVLADALTWKPKDGMEFDLVIGNPPYQPDVTRSGQQGSGHNIWPDFIIRAVEVLSPTGIIALVTPDKWRSPEIPGHKDKLTALRKAIASFGVLTIVTGCDQKYFKIGNSIKIDAFLLQRGWSGPKRVTNAVTGVAFDYPQNLPVARNLCSEIELSILKKILDVPGEKLSLILGASTYAFKNNPKSIAALTRSTEFCYPALTSPQLIGAKKSKVKDGLWLNRKHPIHDELKVVVSWNYAHRAKFDAGASSISDGTLAILVPSDEAGRALETALNSDLINFFVSMFHKPGDMRVPHYLCSLLPKALMFEDPNTCVGLSQEEIAYVSAKA